MSLQITTTITTIEGIELSSAYARVLVVDNFTGTKLDSAIQLYASKEAFLAEKQPLSTEIISSVSTPYDRQLGTDILDLAHDAMIVRLAEQGITSVKSL